MPPFRHREGVCTAADSSSPRKDVPASSGAGTSHSGPRTIARSAAAQSKEELVGPVTETTGDHKRRHRPCYFYTNCPRCQWIQNGDQWCQEYARVPESHRTPWTGEYWCVPRQASRGGQWALGCTVCALVNESCARGSGTPGKSATGKKFLLKRYVVDSKWARHEIRTVRKSSIKQHADTEQHKRALRVLKSYASMCERCDTERLRG